MKNSTRVSLILVPLVLIACRIRASQQFLSVEDVKPGMKGTGKTVFEGADVQEFGVEILGVLRRATIKGDIILGKLSGDPLERTGVISGMSGSPVYLNGKLIGAIAYRYGSFSKEPICGITPISEMMNSLAERTPSQGRSSWPAEGIIIPSLAGLEPFWGGTLVPIASPLYVSGFDQRMVRQIESFCGQFNLIPVLGGQYPGKVPDESPTLEPGSCLGVQLMGGDASLAVTGTVTHIDEARFLAFGHPMFVAGSTRLPMTGGWVHSVLPSQWVSFKITSPTQVLGTVREDRRAGISGTIGEVPELLPLDIDIDGETYGFWLAKEKSLAPLLAGWATLNSTVSSARLLGDLTASALLTVELQGHPALTVTDLVSGDKTPLTLAQHVDEVLRELFQNKFEEVSPQKMALAVSLTEERRTAEIERVALVTQRPSPGDTLELLISLRSYHGESITKAVRIPIPEEAQAGDYTLKVTDGSKYWDEERKRVPLRFEPGSLSELLSLIQARPKGDEIFCQLYSTSPGATVRGEELPSLPPSVLSTMRSSRQSGGESFTQLSLVAERTVDTQILVSGKEEIRFKVR